MNDESAPSLTLNPIPATILASNETQRLNRVAQLGRVRTGCAEIDDYVLLGGLERGSVVGLSAEEEDEFGVPFGLQILARNLVDGSVNKALLITPKPAATILPALESCITCCVAASTTSAQQASARELLDKVMLSCVFDLDGLWEVLAELDRPVAIPDSQSEGDEDEDEGGVAAKEGKPEMVVVTHYSTLLTGLFTQRPHGAAHHTLSMLSSHLRHLSRELPSHPIFLLLNSTTSSFPSSSMQQQQHWRPGEYSRDNKTIDPTLRSIFAAASSTQGYRHGGGGRAIKPSFGLVFAQALDLHLLCTRVPRGKADADAVFDGVAQRHGAEYVTVVEVLLDIGGVWEGRRGARRSREQRWAAATRKDGLVGDAFGKRDEKAGV